MPSFWPLVCASHSAWVKESVPLWGRLELRTRTSVSVSRTSTQLLPLSEYLVHTLGCNAIRSLDSPTAADFLDHIGAGSWVESFAFDIFELADGLCDRGVAFEELLADRGVYAGEFGDVLLELVHGHCRTE